MNAIDGTKGSTTLNRIVLALKIDERILIQRNSRVATLLRAPVNQAIFADIQIPAPCVALPVVRDSASQVVLESVMPKKGEHRLVQLADLVENPPLMLAQRPHLPGAVVNHARDRKSTRLNSSHELKSRMPSSA